MPQNKMNINFHNFIILDKEETSACWYERYNWLNCIKSSLNFRHMHMVLNVIYDHIMLIYIYA